MEDAYSSSAPSLTATGDEALEDQQPRRRRMRWHPTAVVGLAGFGLIVLAVVLAPILTHYDPYDQVLGDRLKPPSAAHLLGTDDLGRDVFARLLYGGRFSLVMTTIAVLAGGVFGTSVGVIAGRVGGIVDDVAMRMVDLVISFPAIIVALVIVALLKPSFATILLAVVVTTWTPYARLARAVTLEVNSRAYIEAAVAVGASGLLIIRKHIIHNILGPVLAMGVLRFGHMLLTIAGLSYLGLGAQPPISDWGAMLSQAQQYMQRMPTLIMAPGLTIFLTALSVTLAGQGLTLMLDPKHNR